MHMRGGNEPLMGVYGGFFIIWSLGGGSRVFAHRENGLFQLGSVRALGSFLGPAVGRGCPLWAQARQEGSSALGSFPAMFSLYTNPESEPLLGVLPYLENPFLLACLFGTTLVCGLKR